MKDKALILAVDDEAESLALLLEILTRAGHDVRPADRGELALEAVAANPPALILLDIHMKGPDGLEVCRRLKAREETRRIPIILISAFADEKDWVEGLRLGAADHITKPFRAEELVTRVNTHLSLSRATVSLDQQAAALRQANQQLQSVIVERQRMADDLRQSLDKAERARLTSASTFKERKRVEAALHAAHDAYVNILATSLDGFWLVGPDTRLLDVNATYLRQSGFSREELIGMRVADLEVMENAAETANHARRIIGAGSDQFETTHRRKDGSIWHVEVSVSYSKAGGGQFFAFLRDITARKQAEEALSEAHDELERRVETRTAELVRANEALQAEISERIRAEEMLRKLSRAIEQTNDCIFLTDREGIIEYVNPAFERVTGFTAEEALGATPRLVKSGEHSKEFFERLWSTILSGEAFRATSVNKAKDGRLYYEDQTIAPLRDGQGTITHFVSTGRNVTRSMRTAAALRRLNDRLEHEAGRIAGVLHDEAGQLLTSAHITLAEVAREVPPSMRERLQAVRRNLDDVEEQLRHLAHELRPRILDDIGLAGALEFLASGVSKRAGIPIGVEVSLQTRCEPLVETAIYRLVQEGLTNMTKHARATRGTVVIKQDGRNVTCSICDDGLGFDVAAVLGRGDSGVGLHGIQDRLEAVNGVFEIISAPGNGTQLRGTIPLET